MTVSMKFIYNIDLKQEQAFAPANGDVAETMQGE